jgi:hypothetical protein
MDLQTELDLLEAAYTKLLAGAVQSYRVGDRELTRLDFKYITARMDILRAAVYRQTNGIMNVARNRRPD